MHQWHEKVKWSFNTHKPEAQQSGASLGVLEIFGVNLADPLPVLAGGGVFSSLLFLSLGFWIYDARCSTSREDESPPGMV